MFGEQAVRKPLRQHFPPRVVKVDIIRHVIQIIVLVDGAVKIIYKGNADIHGGVTLFLQVMAQGAVT